MIVTPFTVRATVAALALLAVAPAMAQTAPATAPTPAGVNMALPILNPDGKPVGDVDCAKPAVPATETEPAKPAEGCHPFTIGYAIEAVLTQPTYPGDEKIDPATLTAQKVAAYFLAEKIKTKDAALSVTGESYMTLSPSEIDYIKRHVAQRFSSPLIVGQVVGAIDPVGPRDFK